MTVYVLVGYIPYEPSNFYGIFSTKELAESAKSKINFGIGWEQAVIQEVKLDEISDAGNCL